MNHGDFLSFFVCLPEGSSDKTRLAPQELNNGRFAMFATSGILAAELYTGQVRMIWWEPPRNSREIGEFRSNKKMGECFKPLVVHRLFGNMNI